MMEFFGEIDWMEDHERPQERRNHENRIQSTAHLDFIVQDG